MDIEETTTVSPRATSRRAFLAGLGGTVAALAVPAPAIAAVAARAGGETRSISFEHLHTGERLHATYWTEGAYDRAALTSIDHILRDFRTGDVHAIEPQLLDVLHVIQTELGTDAPYQVIGGYRSPATNNMLRARSSGVAQHSLHMDGRAIDVRIPGFDCAVLREAAIDLRLGGVGYYKSSNFVHIDTGRPRYW